MGKRWGQAPPTPPIQVEGEDVLLHELLLHQVIEDGEHVVDRDAGVGHAQDAVELGCNEGDARLLGGLPEGLPLHLDASQACQSRLTGHLGAEGGQWATGTTGPNRQALCVLAWPQAPLCCHPPPRTPAQKEGPTTLAGTQLGIGTWWPTVIRTRFSWESAQRGGLRTQL